MHFESSLASGGTVRLVVDLCWRGHDAQQARQRAVRAPGHDSHAQVSGEVNGRENWGTSFACTAFVLNVDSAATF